MSLRANAKYLAFPKFQRFLPLNDDKTVPTVLRILGGAGPFDFSGVVDAAATPITFKTDNGSEVTELLDVATGYGSVSEAAVTVDELVAAITAAAPTNITASKDSTTGRIKIALTTPGTAEYLQVYGEAALIAMIGQGYGIKFVKADTGQSFNVTPTMKEGEELAIQDGNGKETSIVADSYKKGDTMEFVDTSLDNSMKSLIEGGIYNATTKRYEDPHSETTKPYFMVESFYALYNRGENHEADFAGYIKEVFYKVSGQVGGANHDRNINPNTYSLTATNYIDELGVLHGSKYEDELTVTQYNALHLDTV